MGKTEIKPEFVGTAAINSFIANTSSPRAVMDFSHFSAHLPLLTPDEKVVKSGIEYELGKYINDVRADHDYVIKAIVPRYREAAGGDVPTYTILAEYEENGQIFIDFIDVDTFKTSHTFFGYRLKPTEAMTGLSFNSVIPKGTILAKTDSYGEEGAYNYGLNVNMAFMSHPSVSEDGFVVSESFVKRAKFNSIVKRVINITKDTLPVNLYGNKEIFKFLPNIGERVREDGLLCALRDRNDWFSVSDLNDTNISEVDITFDNLIYVNPNSKVLDIKIIRGNYNKQEFSSKMTQQLDEYAAMLINYYTNVVNKFYQLLNEKKTMYGTTDAVRITPRLHRFISDCEIKINSVTSNKNKLCYRKLPIDQYRIEITTISTIEPKEGFKLTDIHAAKGVICKILPDEMMPIDKNGNRVEIITDSAATISRMNLGRAYEAYLGALSRDNRQRLISFFTCKHGKDFLHKVTKEDLQYFYTYMRGLYALINPDMVEFIDSLDQESLHNLLVEVATKHLQIFYPTDNEYNITDVIDNIEQTEYKPLNDKVTYVDELGRTVETVENIRVGQLYFMLLEKIGNSYSAVSSSKVNNFGFPIKGTNYDKFKYPHSLTPTKTMGETEVRIEAALANPEMVADMFDINLNPLSHKFLIKHILESPQAFDPSFNIDRSIVEYGNTKSLAILQHIFNANGIELGFEE
jgi:DNA-directed RNA polymerase beta subunit